MLRSLVGSEMCIRDSVQVVARLRPFLPNETQDRCVRAEGENIGLLQQGGNEEHMFAFDRCYSEQSEQEAIYTNELAPLVSKVSEGFNATLFCYGVTGSGKTYTMSGLIDRAIAQCLALPGYAVRVSYFQILNERLQDLLSDSGEQELQVREKDGRLVIPGATDTSIDSLAMFEAVLERASSNRTTAHTNSNEASSRSHAVLKIQVESPTVTGTLNLIDLAGSEDNRVTGNSGARLVESANINRSLFNLGKVIDALNSKSSHVPYRESKLTRVLQDSLGGQAHTVMIVNLPPGVPFYHHVLNTCLLYTSDAADEEDSVDIWGPRLTQKKKHHKRQVVKS
eukprot:TRINITY_DN62218_c0_g1_i1.p1 TRINITY_DN62218_c0_g1~~TRINITY_DN62218_c0_g1_i1.p1  ORF type:complete len:339 (+),score=82.33 TRINITY_DN62218_c0_g1_i1:86-1102(+)